MSMVHEEATRLKAGRCRSCQGAGNVLLDGERQDCDECGTTGRVRYVEDVPITVYRAYQGGDLVDEGGGLAAFVSGLLAAFGEGGEDLSVWSCEDGTAPRLVAVLRPDGTGRLAARWL